MYQLIRKIHLYTGQAILLFLLMFFVSGYVIVHRDWTGHQHWAAALIRVHETHGYGHGLLSNAFVLFSDISGLSLILFALSGVYLWWKSTTYHFWGWLCLAASCTYGIGMIAYLLYSH